MINIIRAKCNLTNDKQKNIFISHSSKDKAIVQLFVDDVLQLGAGIKPEQIFCTSIEDMGIKNGDDIRKHIHQNIKMRTILSCLYQIITRRVKSV